MGRPVGSPLFAIDIALHVPEGWVLKHNRRRYVFIDALLSKIHQLSDKAYDSLRLYNNFSTTLHRGLYNTCVFYGKRAIDIDKPLREGVSVSVRPRIIIGEGEDSYEKTDPARNSATSKQRRKA
jgi:hypothetical protein